MSNQVFANNMEVACKQGAGKSICAFPDVCFTPPLTPATPPGVPIPYPNTGMDSDATDGSSSVKISGQEVMLKNKSYFKQSTGDEAGSAPKKGVVTSTNKGKVYFNAWSMDVKCEGENVVRHLDLTTHNHNPPPGQTPPWPFAASQAVGSGKDPCEGEKGTEASACKDYKPHNQSPDAKDPCDTLQILKKPTNDAALANQLAEEIALNDCLSARRCRLVEGEKGKGKDKCCAEQTGHHLVEAASFADGRPGDNGVTMLASVKGGSEAYKPSNAPCICAEGTGHSVGGTHELMHALQKGEVAKLPEASVKSLTLVGGGTAEASKTWTYKDAKTSAMKALKVVFQMSGCTESCIEAQLDDYHNRCGIKDDTEIRAIPAGPDPNRKSVLQATDEARALNRKVLESRLAKNICNLISGPMG